MRTLRVGADGDDVVKLKQRLLELGCYDSNITVLKRNTFGKDTQAAVKRFQRANGLDADGVVGPLTYAALFPDEAPQTPQQPTGDREAIPFNIGTVAATSILAELDSASDKRRGIVIDGLQYAYDTAVPGEFPLSLYIRGGNLYNTDLTPNVITLVRIASGAARQPEFYDGGRQEMMERAVRANPTITGADCSGGVVGLLRHAGVVRSGFDLSADGFAANSSYRHISRAELLPGDLLHKPGHIGLYAGGDYGVEWMGGAYGCQLTKVDARRGWDFVKHRTSKPGAWTTFLRPTYY